MARGQRYVSIQERRRQCGAVTARHFRRMACSAALWLSFADPASAQLAGSIAIDSDYRLRGYSLNNDDPAAFVQLSYDHPSGFYTDVTALQALGGSGRFLGVIGNAGYAKRLNQHLTVDGGVLRSQLRAAVPGRLKWHYTEAYAGAYFGPVAARVHYSPDYRIDGLQTLYGELEAGFEPARNWRLSGHVGILAYLHTKAIYHGGDTHRDWRVGVQRQFGRFEIHSAISGGAPHAYYGRRVHKPVAVTIGSSVSF